MPAIHEQVGQIVDGAIHLLPDPAQRGLGLMDPVSYLRGEASGLSSSGIASLRIPANQFIESVLLPGGFNQQISEAQSIARIHSVIGVWRGMREPGNSEADLATSLVYFPLQEHPVQEFRLETVLAHTASLPELCQRLTSIRPGQSNQSPEEWRERNLVATTRLASAIRIRVDYAQIHNNQAELNQAKQALLDEKTAVSVLKSLTAAGPETIETRADLACVTLAVTPEGDETRPDYEPEILIGAMAHPIHIEAITAARALRNRLDSEGNHEEIYALLRQMPTDDNRYQSFWGTFIDAHTHLLAKPEHQREMSLLLLEKIFSAGKKTRWIEEFLYRGMNEILTFTKEPERFITREEAEKLLAQNMRFTGGSQAGEQPEEMVFKETVDGIPGRLKALFPDIAPQEKETTLGHA